MWVHIKDITSDLSLVLKIIFECLDVSTANGDILNVLKGIVSICSDPNKMYTQSGEGKAFKSMGI